MNSPPSRINAGIQAAAPSVDPSSVGQPGEMLLTRVSLAFIDQRINLYLRFGRPQREVRIDRWQRGAFFVPNTIFARVLWQGNDYGTTRWQLMVLQACKPLDAMQRIRGIRPGARTLLHVEGERRVRIILTQIDIIEALGIDPIDVSPSYWQTLGNRLAAGLPTPTYTTERHAAWLTVRRWL
jgi:Protein of unknown function (DUF2840)